MKVYSSRQISRTMSVLIVIAVTAALSLGGAVASAADQEARYLVGFRNAGKAQKADLLRSANATVHRRFHLVPAVAAKMSPTAAAHLAANPNVAYVEPDLQVRALAQDVPWGITRIGAPTVHSTGNTGTSVKVAIIDTGIDYTHPDLAANFKGGYDFVNDDSDPMDDAGHGTHCAGTVAAVNNSEGVLGVAPQVWLYGVKMLDASGEGTLSDAVAGIEWCVDNGIQVASMSWGAENNPISETLQDACAAAYASGVVLVAAAGNSGPGTNTVNQPGILDSVIAVAAADQTDSWAWFSSTGPAVEMTAPGVGIVSTVPGSSYGSQDGTSMACPHVSGVAALIIASGVTGAPQVRERLRLTAQDLGTPGRDEYFGYGLVRADWAAGGRDVIVTGITPNLGANDGPISVSVSGLGFEPGATTQLAKLGQAPIVGTGVTVVSGTQITCQFGLTGADGGAWDVVVTNPGADPAVLPEGLYVLGDVDEDFETGDFSRWPWVTSGDADWTVSNADSHTGAYSARAGSMPAGGSSNLEVTLTCGAGDISFFKQLSCVAGVLIFYVDGDYVGEWSGVSAWDSLPAEYMVSAGIHTFKWEYWDLVGDPQGTVWLDDVSFPPLAGEHALSIIAGPSGTPNPVGSGGGVACSVSAQDTLGHALTYAWTATGGAFDDATSAAPTWTAPSNTGEAVAEYTIEVTVSCAQDATLNDTGSYVQQVNPEGTATVTGITPVTGINAGPVGVTISGSDFETGATTQLTRSGHSPIAGTGVTVVSGTQITCQFNLLGATEGGWDVDVTNPGADPATLVGGFQIIGDVDEDFETGDFSRWPWTTSGEADWVVTNTDSHNGTYSASAGGMSTDGSSYLQLTLTCDAGNISFHKKLSCLGGFLIFYVDGSAIGEWNGAIDWGAAPDEIAVSAGTHTFKWEYWDLVGDPLGFVWVDDISFPPVAGSHTVTITAGPTGTPNPVDSEGEVVCSVTAQDSRGHALTYAWTATGGSFDDVASPAPTWTAPANTGDEIAEYTIGVTVRCAEDPSIRAADSYVQQVTVANTPPTQPTVEVTPDTPATGNDLQVAASDSTDADGDTVSYSYKWYKDDVHQDTYDDLTTVPASATATGDVWKCVVTPNDGKDDGPSGEASVTVAPNPTLEWVGDTGFEGDGVDPNMGDLGADFRFRVKYTGPAPEYVNLLLYRDGVAHPSNPFALTAGKGTPATGQVFYLRKALRQDCAWSYQFESRTEGSLATGPPTAVSAGPFIGNPTLEWVGDTGFESDGVDPNIGNLGSDFRFRVKYTGPSPEYVSLLLYRDGVAHPNNPFALIAGKGTPTTGQVFYLRKTLNQDCAWSYQFEARAEGILATGPPTAVSAGPFIGSPRLTWAGDAGFEGDGVDPNSGAVGSSFLFRVEYTGPAPEYVNLLLYRDGVAHPSNPFVLTPGKGTPTTGQVFYLRKTLNQDCAWSYRFSARAEGIAATGPPTAITAGPFVGSPRLAWVGDTGFESDGVDPNIGELGADFRFRVEYSGPVAPQYVNLLLYRDGVPHSLNPFAMIAGRGAPTTGQVFYLRKALNQDCAWSYQFKAFSDGVWATGPPTAVTAGPMVSPKSTGTVVATLACCPTELGAQMTLTLSADASVTCEVLNIAGRAVKTIVLDRPMTQGIKSLTWDGRNSAGLRTPSGMYLVRMTATSASGSRWTLMGMLNLTR